MTRQTAIGLLLALLLAGCSGPDDGGSVELRSAAILVESDEDDGSDLPADLPAMTAVPGAPENSVVVEGHVEPSSFADVRFDVPGKVAELRVEQGQFVRKGDVLAVLETSDREAKLDEARARLRDARTANPGGGATRSGEPLPGYLEAEMEERLRDAESRADHQSSDRARFDRAARSGGEEAARDAAIAIASRRNSGTRGSGATRRAAGERLAVALIDDLGSRVRGLEDAIERSTLRAPVSGEVVAIEIYEGGQWNTRSVEPAFQILDPDSNVVRARVPAELARLMRLDEQVWVAPMGSKSTATGTVAAIAEDEFRVTTADGSVVRLTEVLFGLPEAASRALEVGEIVRVAIRR